MGCVDSHQLSRYALNQCVRALFQSGWASAQYLPPIFAINFWSLWLELN